MMEFTKFNETIIIVVNLKMFSHDASHMIILTYLISYIYPVVTKTGYISLPASR